MTEAYDRHKSADSRTRSKNVSGTLTHLDILPALPKLRGKCTVVTTKLCEAVSECSHTDTAKAIGRASEGLRSSGCVFS